MLELIFKVVMTAVPVLLAVLTPYLSYRHNRSKHNATLREMLSREMNKSPPCAYQIESCVAELHCIKKPLPAEFLLLVLPCGHALELIQLVSTGRRALDLFDVSVTAGRPHVQYTSAFSTSRKRIITMTLCFATSLFSLINFSIVYWSIIDVVFAASDSALSQGALISTLLYKLAVIMMSLATMHVFQLQAITLKRSAMRLRQIHTLISANFPESAADNAS